jgi:hypothetical protein
MGPVEPASVPAWRFAAHRPGLAQTILVDFCQCNFFYFIGLDSMVSHGYPD